MPEQKKNKEEQEAYDEALKRIKRCRRSGKGADKLGFAGLGLTKLPAEIGQLTALAESFLEYKDYQARCVRLEVAEVRSLRNEFNESRNGSSMSFGSLYELFRGGAKDAGGKSAVLRKLPKNLPLSG